MAVPKRKTSISKRGMRRANQGLSRVHYIICAECEAQKLSHLVCPQCGTYNNMQITKKVNTEEEDTQGDV